MAAPLLLAALAGFGADQALESRSRNREAEQRGTDADNLLNAMGIGPDLGPMPDEIATIRDLLVSPNAEARAQGVQLAGQQTTPYQQAQEAAARQAQQEEEARLLGLDRERLGLSADQLALGQSAFDLQQAQVQAERDAVEWQQAQALAPYLLEQEQEAATQARLETEKMLRGEQPDLTKPVLVPDPARPGQQIVAYRPGTKEHNQLQGNVDVMQQTIRDLNRYRALLEQYGSEFMNQSVVGQMNAIRAGVMPRLSSLEGQGAIQDADLKIIEQRLPDATGFAANLAGMTGYGLGGAMYKDRALAGLDATIRMMEDKLIAAGKLSPFVTYDPMVLNPERQNPTVTRVMNQPPDMP